MVEQAKQREGAKLTEARLARAAAKKRAARLYDSGISGFGAKVSGSGKVSFFLRYGPRGARRFLTLGSLGESFSLRGARKLATEMLGQVARGKDPVAARAAAGAKAVLFPIWAATYLERTSRLRKMKSPPAFYLAIAAKRWARRSLASITKSDVLDLRAQVAEEGGKIGAQRERDDHEHDGHPRANRFLAHLAACFKAAVDESLIPLNPAKGIKQLPENPPRARVLTDDEMERLVVALEDEDQFTAAVFHTLIETGLRVSEILGSRWADFDLVAGTMRIPSPKSGFPQMIPLAEVTVERLKKLPEVSGWLIPARGDLTAHRNSMAGDWARLKDKAQLGDAHIHDIRRTYGLAVARGSGLHVASVLLRHSSVQVTASVYSPLDIGMQREATEARAKLLAFPKKKGAA